MYSLYVLLRVGVLWLLLMTLILLYCYGIVYMYNFYFIFIKSAHNGGRIICLIRLKNTHLEPRIYGFTVFSDIKTWSRCLSAVVPCHICHVIVSYYLWGCLWLLHQAYNTETIFFLMRRIHTPFSPIYLKAKLVATYLLPNTTRFVGGAELEIQNIKQFITEYAKRSCHEHWFHCRKCHQNGL